MDHTKIRLNRRNLLKLAGAGITTAILGGCSESQSPTAASVDKVGKNGKRVLPWKNWSGNQASQPSLRLVPKNEEQIIDAVVNSKQTIRCVGAGHSFSPLVPTDETLMSLARLRGIDSVNLATQQVDIWAGSRLSTLGTPLWQQQLGLLNMPDIDTQALAGAIATSTHGTGISLGSISSSVTNLRIISASGEIIECNPEQTPELFHAATNHLGALGVVTRVRLQTRPAYYLKERIWMMKLDEGLEQIETLRDTHRHFEMYALPHADYILAITQDEINPEEVSENHNEVSDAYETFRSIANVIDWLPFMRSRIINSAASSVEPEKRSGRSFEIFSNLRDIRFNEMEYSIPAELGPKCLKEILDTIKSHNIDIIFPIEYRYVKGDDIWLSPFYGRDSCTISCHNFHDRDHKKYFALVEPIFWKYEGRPHWGKIHNLNHKELLAIFPKMSDFLQVRQQIDPAGKFLNAYLKKIFGLI